MLFKITTYLRFLFGSTNQHGVHSPFIYKLLTECLYRKSNAKHSELITQYRHKLLQNSNYIQVTDFGKGSKVFKSNTRQISKIAKIAGTSKKKGLLLARLVNYFAPNQSLEIGTSLGIATAALKVGNPNGEITSLEGCPNTLAIAQEQFKTFGFDKTTFINGDFKSTLPKTVQGKQYDFIYVDGNHQKMPTLNYFNILLNHIHNNSLLLFDDIHWSQDMEEAWEEIKKHPKVRVTIDCYFWGFVFFRKEQAKEHFKIRI